MRRSAGFTLIELVVVLGIFAVVSVMAYGGLNTVLNVRGNVQRAMDRTAAMQKAWMRLRDDLEQVADRPVRDGGGEPLPALEATADGVEFTRGGWRNPLLHPRPTLERVAYRIDDKKRLVRLSWPMLDRAPESVPVEVPILDDVDQMQWRFLDSNLQWQDQWPASGTTGATGTTGTGGIRDTPPPPRAVEVTLQTRDWGELKFLFSSGTHHGVSTGQSGAGATGQMQ